MWLIHLWNRTNAHSFPQQGIFVSVKAWVDDMRKWRDQMLSHQFVKLSWYAIRASRAVRSQFLYLSKHFLMSEWPDRNGRKNASHRKTIDQPVHVLVEHWRWRSDTLSRRLDELVSRCIMCNLCIHANIRGVMVIYNLYRNVLLY